MLRLHFRAFDSRPLNNIDETDRITGRAVGFITSKLATSPARHGCLSALSHRDRIPDQ